MDQRTRERLPVLETFGRAVADHHAQQLARLQNLLAVPPGATFTIGDAVFVRTKNATTAATRDEQGTLRHFGQAEHRAFSAWAAVEFLRHTGARIEEMLEISHHAMIRYRLPTTGEIVPLLQIAPSKTDQERVVLVSPELADVLATIIRRVRDLRTGAIPLLSAYDYEEHVWNPPSPLLFQWDRGGERSRMSGEFIRSALGEILAFIGLTDSTAAGRFDDAWRLAARLREICEPTSPSAGDDTREVMLGVRQLEAALCRAEGSFAASADLDRITYERTRTNFGEDSPTTLAQAPNVAANLRLTGKVRQALELDLATLSLFFFFRPRTASRTESSPGSSPDVGAAFV